jgi:hypothetical protein
MNRSSSTPKKIDPVKAAAELRKLRHAFDNGDLATPKLERLEELEEWEKSLNAESQEADVVKPHSTLTPKKNDNTEAQPDRSN